MDPNVQVRRATIEDLPQLTALWQQENLSVPDLERRLKEFQVVQSPDGEVLGVIGLQISGTQGRLHSEALLHPEQGDEVRDRLWERIRLVAGNCGVARVWLQGPTPFWKANGFQPAGTDDTSKLPADFSGAAQPWYVLKLREESAAASIDKEFALFREAERERTAKMYRQAKVLKMIAVVVAMGVFLLVIVWAFIFFTKYRGPFGKQ